MGWAILGFMMNTEMKHKTIKIELIYINDSVGISIPRGTLIGL